MLRKTKIFLLIGSVILLTLIVILITRSLSSRTGLQPEPVLPESQTGISSILNQSNPDTALKTKQILLPNLPIYIYNFKTSSGITTDISISSYKNDSPEMIRVEIFGPDYLYNQTNPNTNPNMVAFKESFEKVISILSENNVDIKDLHISMGNKKYIRDIAEEWIKTLNLLP